MASDLEIEAAAKVYAEATFSSASAGTIRKGIRAALEAAEKARPSVPDGWKLVPIEPTEAMEDWAVADLCRCLVGQVDDPIICGTIYRAMLSASPEPTKE